MILDARFEVHAGKRLRVATIGSGPPLICLHGYPDNLQLYSRLLPILGKDRTAVAFDWPGLGDSEAQSGGATPEHQAERLIALLDDWGLGSVDLIGFDMGGQPALVAAARHPDRIRRVVIMSSLVAPEAETSLEIRLLRRYGLNRFFLGHTPRMVYRRCEHTFLAKGERLDPDVRDDFQRTFYRDEVRAFLIRMCAGYEARLSRLPELYPSIKAPLLALWPDEDAHFPISHAELLLRTIPGAKLEVVHGGRHWMPYTRADEIGSKVRSFLA